METTLLNKATEIRSETPSNFSQQELSIRIELAATYRLVDFFGWCELIYGHLTAHFPGPEPHFLINPYGLNYDEVTATNLIKIDINGKMVEPSPYAVNEAGFVQLGRVNTQFFFYGNDSFDPEGSSLNYSWNFGDDSTDLGMYTNHTYTAAGNYTVILTVTDERNISSSINSWTIVKNYEYNISFQEIESSTVLSSPPNRLLEGETNTTIWTGQSNLTSVKLILEWSDDIQTLEDLQNLGFSDAAIDAISSIFGVFFPDTFELSINTTEISGLTDFSEQSSSEYIEADYTNITEIPDNPGIFQFETNNGVWIWLENNFPSNETAHNNWTVDVTCIHASPDDVLGFFFDPDDGNNFTLSVTYTYYDVILTEISIV